MILYLKRAVSYLREACIHRYKRNYTVFEVCFEMASGCGRGTNRTGWPAVWSR